MTEPNRTPDLRRTELGDFLRSQRAQLQPVDAGLPPGPGQRRTPGLRREEVAQLAGVGLTWYTWLEQGRDIPASRQVIDALARALRMTPDKHRHLRALADLPVPGPDPAPAEALPRLQRLVDASTPNAASVYDSRLDYLVWNSAYVRVRCHDPAEMPPGRRNLLWALFTDDSPLRQHMVRWEPAARAVLSQFRTAAGQHTDDPRFTELTDALTEASGEFRDWWADYPVAEFAPNTIAVNHPTAGRVALELFQLRPVEHPDVVLVVQVPATDQDRQRTDALLAQQH